MQRSASNEDLETAGSDTPRASLTLKRRTTALTLAFADFFQFCAKYNIELDICICVPCVDVYFHATLFINLAYLCLFYLSHVFRNLEDECVSLLLYHFTQANRDFYLYILSRVDVDTLVRIGSG